MSITGTAPPVMLMVPALRTASGEPPSKAASAPASIGLKSQCWAAQASTCCVAMHGDGSGGRGTANAAPTFTDARVMPWIWYEKLESDTPPSTPPSRPPSGPPDPLLPAVLDDCAVLLPVLPPVPVIPEAPSPHPPAPAANAS